MKCKECGYENENGAKFCNQCGCEIHEIIKENEVKVNNNQTNTISEIIREDKTILSNISKKKKIIIGVLLVIALIGCIGGYLYYDNYKYQTGYNLTEDEKVSNINEQLAKNNYDGAETLVNNYFYDTTELKDYLNNLALCKNDKSTSLNDAEKIHAEKSQEKKSQEEKKLEEEKQKNIAKGKDREKRIHEGVSIGMTKDEVLMSNWGKPKDINKTTNANGTNEQWVYSGNRYLYFDDEILTTIQD